METGKLHISFEKVLLLMVLVSIWSTVLVLEKLMPHHSAAVLILVFMMFYSMLIFIANLHHRRKLAKGIITTPDLSDYNPSVSIIIPAHNESSVISETVKNLMAIDYDNYDLLVIDDRSTDNTFAILEQLSHEFTGSSRFNYFRRNESAMPGKSAVLNDAMELANGEIIAVFDADGRVSPDFLKKTIPYMLDPDTGAIQVRKHIINSKVNLLTRCQHHEYLLDAHFQTGRNIIKGAVELRGNGQLIKRNAVQSVGGWNEDTVTDDLDLSTKLHLAGWDIRFIGDISVEEEGIISFKPLLRQRKRWAEGSLKRYLEHFVAIFTSPYASYRATLDMLAYFLKFLFPVWVTADVFFQLLNLALGEWPNHLISSLIMLPAVGIFFLSGLFVTIYQYERPGILKSFLWAVESAIYMLIVWVPVVMWIILKILLTRDEGPLNWGKTEHLGTQPVAVKLSRLRRLKNMLQKQRSSTTNP